MAEVFPDSWLRPDALLWVIDFIEWLPIDPKVRKRTLLEWAKHAGVELTAVQIERVTGLPAGEV